MIKLERKLSWYRPYVVTASGKEYVLESIRFYDVEGNIVLHSSGWLQDVRGMDIQEIELPTDKITRRNKVKFDGEVFGTIHPSYNNESRLNLYIPMSMLNIRYECKKKMYGDRVYECYTGDQGIYLTKYIKSLDAELTIVKSSYEALLSDVSLFNMMKDPNKTIENLEKMIKVVEAFKEERQKIDSIVVEG